MATYNAYGGQQITQGPGFSASRFSDQDIQSAFTRLKDNPMQMQRFLQWHQLTPEMAAQAIGPNGQETVNAYVAANPQMQDWAQGRVQFHDYRNTGAEPMQQAQPAQNFNSPATPAGTPASPQLGMGPQQYNSPATPAGTPQPPQLGMPSPTMQTMPQPPSMPQAQGMSQPQQPQNPFGGMNGGASGNPYLGAMAGNLARTAANTLQRQILPGIRGQAVAAGGVGGSRQGVAEGLAVGGTMDALGGALTNLYGNAYGQDQQYDLANQRIGLDTYNSNQNWMRLGQNDQLNALNTMMGWQGQGINLANQQQQQPLQNWQQFANTGAQLGGMGASNTQTLQGNPWLGALGGMQLGTKLFGG